MTSEHSRRDTVSGQSLRATWRAGRAGTAVVWRASPRLITLAVALQVAAGVLIGAQLLLAQSVINEFADKDSEVTVTASLIAILVVTAVTGLIGAVLPDLLADIGERVSADASAEVLRIASGVEAIAFEEPGFHDLLQRASFAAQGRNRDIASALLSLIGAMFAAGSVLVAVMFIEPLLAPPVVVAGLPMIWANRRNSRAFRTFVHDMTEHDRRRMYFWNVLTNPVAAKETRAHRLGGDFRRRHRTLQDERVAAYDRLVIDRVRRSIVGALFGSVVVVLTILFLVDRLNSDALGTGEVGAAILGVLLLTQRSRALLSNAGRIYESALFISDYLDLLALPVGPDVLQGRAGPVSELRASNVEFQYPGANDLALRGVDLVARRGEVIALVGENGSGKSTLAHVLGAVYAPTAGEISVDGELVDSTTLATHRDRVAFVFQDFVRWALTGRENIALGRLDGAADDDAIVDAARRADADSFLADRSEGYDTILSRLFRGGTDLSLGQWQRIATARLIFRDAPIVIFDEPTASLDPVAEQQIFDLVRRAMTDRVVVLISHRLSSVKMADRIYVLEKGVIVEEGSHDELVDAGGAYQRLYRAQAVTFEGEDDQ